MTLEEPLISIIIPTFNRAHLIGATLESVLVQKYQNWECIVVDDGSTDGTEILLKSYVTKDGRFEYHQRPNSHLKGGNGARNYGLELANGAFIQWFDSDDLMYPHFLEAQCQNIIEKGAGFSLCLYDMYYQDSNELRLGEPPIIRDGFYLDYIRRKLPANLPSIMFKKSILQGFTLNEQLLKSQEYEFLQRFFREHQAKGVLLKKSLIKIIRHNESITEIHTTEKITSALEALLITFSELPKGSPFFIKKELTLMYLQTLYIAFTNRMSLVFYRYLFKTINFQFFKGLITIMYAGLLYMLVKIFPIGNWHYKRIYKLYA